MSGLVDKLQPALKLLDGLEVGQDCEEYAYAKNATGFQAMTYTPEAFEALRALPDAIDHIESLTARVAELEGALEPFADAAEDLDETTPDRCSMWEHHVSMNVEAGDFRRARAALGER